MRLAKILQLCALFLHDIKLTFRHGDISDNAPCNHKNQSIILEIFMDLYVNYSEYRVRQNWEHSSDVVFEMWHDSLAFRVLCYCWPKTSEQWHIGWGGGRYGRRAEMSWPFPPNPFGSDISWNIGVKLNYF